jgi:hypothetical protein
MLNHKAAGIAVMPNGHSRMAMRKNMNQGINFVEYEGAPDIRSMPDLYQGRLARLSSAVRCCPESLR